MLVRGSLAVLCERFASEARGEITIVVAGDAGEAAGIGDAELDRRIRALAETGVGTRELAERLAAETGLARRALYARARALAEEAAPRPDADAPRAEEDAARAEEDALE